MQLARSTFFASFFGLLACGARPSSPPTTRSTTVDLPNAKTSPAAASSDADDVTRTQIPSLRVPKLKSGVAIVVDGNANDAAWSGAPWTEDFVDVSNGKPKHEPIAARAKIAWDDRALYVLVDVTCADVSGGFGGASDDRTRFTIAKQPKLWTHGDDVALFVDPGRDGDNVDYDEVDVSPENAVFHSRFDRYNAPVTLPDGPFGHEDWDPKMKSAIHVEGTIDQPKDHDEGFTVEMAIPWSAFASANAPAIGDVWRMNLYAMKDGENAIGWSAILGKGNIHRASRFAYVTFSS
jgi:hypothetical protein